MAQLKVSNICHVFPSPSFQALQRISFSVARGEIAALVGPSGCGKTTLIRIMAGLLSPTEGTVLLKDRRLGLVFQEDSLYPWLSLQENVELAVHNLPQTERESKALSALQSVGLGNFSSFYPQDVSSGMKQRAALARALVQQPSVLLLDEPFASLDAKTREDAQLLLLRLLEEKNCTALLVTHDLEEAIFLADSIYVLSRSPGSIIRRVENPLPRPRRPAIKKHNDFLAVQVLLLKLLREGA